MRLSPGLFSTAILLTICFLAGCVMRDNVSATRSPSPEPTTLNQSQRLLYRKALNDAKEGQYRNAQAQLQKLVRQKPDHPELRTNLAMVYYHRGECALAREAIERALILSPGHAQAHNLAGILALTRGNPKQAEQAFLQALQKDSQLAEAHYNLALLYDTYYQDLAPAAKHYRAYLQLKSNDETTRQWLQQLEASLNR